MSELGGIIPAIPSFRTIWVMLTGVALVPSMVMLPEIMYWEKERFLVSVITNDVLV